MEMMRKTIALLVMLAVGVAAAWENPGRPRRSGDPYASPAQDTTARIETHDDGTRVLLGLQWAHHTMGRGAGYQLGYLTKGADRWAGFTLGYSKMEVQRGAVLHVPQIQVEASAGVSEMSPRFGVGVAAAVLNQPGPIKGEISPSFSVTIPLGTRVGIGAGYVPVATMGTIGVQVAI